MLSQNSLSEAAVTDAMALEVPIILVSAAKASALGAVIICLFEAVRIRTVLPSPILRPTRKLSKQSC